MGFASMRGDLGLASTCGMELRLFLVDAWGGAVSSHHGWIGGARQTVGGVAFDMRERVELDHN